MFRLLLIIHVLFLGCFPAIAQTPRFTNTFEGFANANTFPLGLSSQRKTEHHILAHEFTGAAAGSIVTLYVRRAAAQSASTTYTNLSIRMAQTPAISFSGNGFWTTGLVTVLSAPSLTIPPGGADTWVPFTLSTRFPYDPSQSLVIVICQGGATGGGISLRVDGGSETVFRRIFGSGCSSASGTADRIAYAFGIDLDSENASPTALCRDVSVFAGENCRADASIDNGSFDPDNDPITLEQTPPGPYPAGTTGVTLTVTDRWGAASTCRASVTVRDDTPPVVRTTNVTIPITGSGEVHVTAELLAAGSTDNCGIAAMTVSPNIFTCDDIGDRTVLVTAVDNSGNSATAQAVVTVADVTPPVLALNPESVVLWPPQHQYARIDVSRCVLGVTDDCDAEPELFISSVTCDEPEEDPNSGDGNTTDDIVIAPDCRSLLLRSERDNRKNGRVYRILLRAADASGNTADGEFRVSVAHDQNREAVATAPVYEVVSACGTPTLDVAFRGGPPLVELEENYPEPFNPSTTILLNVLFDSRVRLSVSDRFGRVLSLLADEFFTAGKYTKSWTTDSSMPSGVYYATILARSTDGRETYSNRAMVLVK